VPSPLPECEQPGWHPICLNASRAKPLKAEIRRTSVA
jgi:hypothetical protein